MRVELTAQQEDLICEPREKCEFCKGLFPKDDITTAKIEGGEVCRLCEGCKEELETTQEEAGSEAREPIFDYNDLD